MKRFLLWLLLIAVLAGAAVLVAVPCVIPAFVAREVERRAAEQGFDVRTRLQLGYCWRNGPGITGTVSVASREAPWRVRAAFAASCGEYAASVRMEPTLFDENDPLVRDLLVRYPMAGVTNLALSGSVALQADVVRTFSRPFPVWSVRVPLRDVSVSCATDEGRTVAVTSLSVTPSVSGIADHVDVAPAFVRAAAFSVNGFEFTAPTASLSVDARRLLLTEATAGLCGGQAGVYALRLDWENLNTGLTCYLDGVDAGQMLAHLKDFRGHATGRLHGKVRLSVREGGRALRFRDAYLYSTPGEYGKLQLRDAAKMASALAMAGVDEASRADVAAALTDLDYSVLRLNLVRGTGREAKLSTRIVGTAARGGTKVPVDVAVNVTGEIEQLVNFGLDCNSKAKGRGMR